MKTAITITARLKSKRLPKKVIKKIEGKPMIEHQIERLKCAKLPDEIILCTSTNPQDDILVEVAEKTNIACFRGSEEDVLERLLEAAKKYYIDFIVSTTADNPLTDPQYIDKTIEKFNESNADYITSLDLPFGTFSYGVKVAALDLRVTRNLK
jgi:spore coat polysaccharide biosynthesis protein SpsF